LTQSAALTLAAASIASAQNNSHLIFILNSPPDKPRRLTG
jgi:hypothetical protein